MATWPEEGLEAQEYAARLVQHFSEGILEKKYCVELMYIEQIWPEGDTSRPTGINVTIAIKYPVTSESD